MALLAECDPLANPGTGAPSLTSPLLNLSGTATDDTGDDKE